MEALSEGLSTARSQEHDLTEETLESVRRNLRRLLRARIGMSAALPDYGLPALSDVLAENKGDIKRFVAAVQNTIRKYEPRLQQVQASVIEDESGATPPHKLRLRIEATLPIEGRRHRVAYQAAVAADGSFEVSG